MEVSPELRLTPRSSGQLLWPDYLVPIDGRWPIHALPRTPLSRLVRPAQRAVAQRLRALTRCGHRLCIAAIDKLRFSISATAGGARFREPIRVAHCDFSVLLLWWHRNRTETR